MSNPSIFLAGRENVRNVDSKMRRVKHGKTYRNLRMLYVFPRFVFVKDRPSDRREIDYPLKIAVTRAGEKNVST